VVRLIRLVDDPSERAWVVFKGATNHLLFLVEVG